MFDPLGRSQELLRLNVSSTLHKYHLALDAEEKFLYMSDPANYRIIRIPLLNLKALQPHIHQSDFRTELSMLMMKKLHCHSST
jgi:hypothetical protein